MSGLMDVTSVLQKTSRLADVYSHKFWKNQPQNQKTYQGHRMSKCRHAGGGDEEQVCAVGQVPRPHPPLAQKLRSYDPQQEKYQKNTTTNGQKRHVNTD